MTLTGMYAVIATSDVARSAEYFRTHFDFETTFESDWYVSLRHGAWELAVLRAGHPTIPAAYREQTAAGVLINLEVTDVDAVHDRLVSQGLAPVLSLRSEDFGQRHAIFPGPDGVLIDVITPIPPRGDFVAQFSHGALEEARSVADVQVREPVPTIAVRRTVESAALQSFQGEALGKLFEALRRSGVRTADAPYVRYHRLDEGHADVEVGLVLASAVDANGDVVSGSLPGGTAVTWVHHGDHSGLGQAYASLLSTIESRGLAAEGPAWETYHWIDPSEPLDPSTWPAPTSWRTTLVQPVRG